MSSMKGSKKGLSVLLCLAIALSILRPLPARALEVPDSMVDLVNSDCAVSVSSEQTSGITTAQYAVDGIFDQQQQWASGDMKAVYTLADDTQIPQWLTVDLGQTVTDPVEIEAIKLWYNMKVWPMVYEIQTSSDNGKNDPWERVVRVERDPFDGGVKNAAGQNIADETGNDTPDAAANTDTITKSSSPALADNAAVERYVRFYVEKVNTEAPGNNVCLREISIYTADEQPNLLIGEAAWNLAEGRQATASDSIENTSPANAVDGDTGTSWNSGNLKDFVATDSSRDTDSQTPQWLQIDLGAAGSNLEQIKISYNAKVWAMDYVIQTTDTPEVDSSWKAVVSVSRPSANANVTNGSGQTIADTASNTDTITTSSTPALAKTTLGRYVRMYINKTNTQAPGGNNVNIVEFELRGTNPNIYPPVDVDAELSNVTVTDPAPSDQQIVLPEVAAGAELVVRGSTQENVVSNDGAISKWNIGEREVTLLLRIAEKGNEDNYAEKNVSVTVPDHRGSYPAEWFPAVSNPNPKPEVIPTVQEWYGYEGNFTLTDTSKIVLNDAASVGLDKVAANLKADVAEICGITMEVVNGNAPTGPNDIYIESLTTSDDYDLGDEGYLMVTNGEGLHIYAPTYTGCLYGTITAEQILWQAEDHASIPMGIMRDYPAYEVRGLMLDVARTPYRYEQLQDYAKIMLWYKMNEYHLHISDNDNANINGATFDTHSGFHRLESDTFPSLTSETKHAGIPAELVNEEYYNSNADYQGNPTYTKEQWQALESMCEDLGMYVLTEIDLPGHSMLYNKYAESNPDQIDWLDGGTMLSSSATSNSGYLELLDLTGDNAGRALQFAQTLWDEYTGGTNPVVSGDVVHIGSDEYWVHNTVTNDAFARFADSMRQVIQGNLGTDTKIRMWGAGTGSFATAPSALNTTHQELAANYQLDIWSNNYDNAAQRTAEGYQVINCRDAFLYGNPGRTNRDVPNAEYLFYDWNPTIFGGGNPRLGEPNLVGAKAVIWGDQSQEGMIEKDIHQRVLRAIAIVSEKTWDGTDADDTFTEYELRASRLAEGPGTQIAMEIDSASSLVLDYDFANVSGDGKTVYDASGNGYDAALTGGSVSDGWLAFDGNTLLETPLKTLSYPYTVSFDLKLDAGNTEDSSLFSGYDGRIQAAGHDGKLSADVNYFTRDFDYQVPTNNTTVNLTIVGTFQATRLYVDGQLVSFLSQKQDQDGLTPGAISTLYSSVVLPLEKIGQDLHGQMANLKVYNKAMSAEEVAAVYQGTDDGMVNVAQNTHAGGDSYETGDANDNAEQRTRIAMKAVDGEAFPVKDDPAAQPDAAASEIYSYWQGDHADSSLTIDLGQTRTISQVDIQWRYGGKGKDLQILTSLNGQQWDVAKEVTGNQDFFETILLDQPVTARFVKVQGIQSNAGNGNTYYIQELLVYEQVEKSELGALLTEAEQIVSDQGLTFESTGAGGEMFRAVVLARALSGSPLATIEEVEQAVVNLEAAIKAMEDGGDSAAPIITTTDLHDGTVGQPYIATLTADSDSPVIWELESGSTLPNGLTLDRDGRISGTPTTAGIATFTVTATNDFGTSSKAFSLKISDIPATTHTISASVSPAEGGSVTVNGSSSPASVADNSTVTLTATANKGYRFAAWVENGAIVSRDAAYTFTADNDRSLTAQFEKLYTVTVTANPEQGGTVKVDKTMAVAGETVTLTATANANYHFTGWTSSNNVIFDDALSASTTFTMPAADTVITAKWVYNDDSSSDDSGSSDDSSSGDSSSDSSSSDSSSSQNQTETTTNSDGSITTTVTEPDGTITKTTVSTDGSKTVVETKPDGNATTTITQPNGSSSVTKVDESGIWESEVKVPERAVDAAEEKGESVALPLLGVPNTSDRDRAPTITVQLPEGDEVMVEIPVDEATSGTVAVLVNQDGTEEVIKTTVTTENGVTVTLTDGQRVKIVDNSKYFSDVPDGYWGEQSIDFVASREIFGGTGPNLFSPELAMTRGMMVTVLARMEGVDTSTGSVWYEAGQKWAMANGISDGTNMEQGLTREQLALMLYRYAGAPTVSGNLDGFADGASVSGWAAEGMIWAVQEGLISGMGNNMLNPQGQASRAQVATLLMRFIANGLM